MCRDAFRPYIHGANQRDTLFFVFYFLDVPQYYGINEYLHNNSVCACWVLYRSGPLVLITAETDWFLVVMTEPSKFGNGLVEVRFSLTAGNSPY